MLAGRTELIHEHKLTPLLYLIHKGSLPFGVDCQLTHFDQSDSLMRLCWAHVTQGQCFLLPHCHLGNSRHFRHSNETHTQAPRSFVFSLLELKKENMKLFNTLEEPMPSRLDSLKLQIYGGSCLLVLPVDVSSMASRRTFILI